MSELRDLVIDAHGGIARWNEVKTIEGDMSITGGLWARKGWPDVLKNVHVTAAAGNQWISYHMHPRPHRDRDARRKTRQGSQESPRRL
jgi:hypothetical protein